jgi:hypothetical protein
MVSGGFAACGVFKGFGPFFLFEGLELSGVTWSWWTRKVCAGNDYRTIQIRVGYTEYAGSHRRVSISS